ncbi:type II secretion system ATPase GspE [Roseateles depolymerans]|uniref:Type II secretion system protein E n=1 Tax=Roseateles depolymerans TaxID=76731 RepID=A0A0U3LBK3_9BURK|nr:type II secretion system ATPase GspE [Roseateles depolymerans]ALV05439.1 general secretion pathway protein E [Roseateles depolymerans]REG14545.1 type II secretion system protein E (GspE) [Roseateles depolymerans]
MATRHPLPYAFARSQQLLLEDDGEQRTLWATPVASLSTLSELQRVHAPHRVECISPADMAARLQAAYAGGEDSAALVVGEVESAVDLSRLMQDLPAVEDLLEAADDAPIIRMLNALLTQAANNGASDIHIEPYERESSVRFRVDGTLREVVRPNRALHAALISRLKIMAELDIAEKRLPQDGRISLRIGGRAIDVRVSTLPSAHGERAVLRLLDKSESKFTLTGLGMDGERLARFQRLVQQPHGIVLVTGPTGSGKTTTLYAAMQTLDTSTTNVLTVEDPIEYELAGVGQTQVNARIDLTFAKALRAILRQDPDVIMIGEIRDYETAQIAIQASLTGHLVLATLHTNDAVSAVTRLTDMGVEPFLLSSSLLGVLAQRLVRKLCPVCKTPAPSPLPGGGTRYQPVGCQACSSSGYKGRTGVYELMVCDDKIRHLIHGQAAESDLLAAARANGLRSMREDGDRLVAAGVTSEEEVLRVTRE